MAPAKLTCLLFDLDGTLIDSMGLIFASYRHALREVLGLAVSEEALVACFGKPLVQGLACLAGLPLQSIRLVASAHAPGVGVQVARDELAHGHKDGITKRQQSA